MKSWVLSVCVAGIAATLAQMIVPKGNMEKVVKITVRAFFLSVILAPLMLNWDINADFKDTFENKASAYGEILREETDKMIEDGLSEELRTMIQAELSEINVTADSIEVLISATDAHSAEITGVTVKLKSEYKIKQQDIQYRIGRITSKTPKLVYTEEN